MCVIHENKRQSKYLNLSNYFNYDKSGHFTADANIFKEKIANNSRAKERVLARTMTDSFASLE